ncbi:hypothetical protein BV25DRAFT_1883167 [Artomyces pyxidatus]|uniref:Uncharacterized protein n=1 Tax=Artomyces pyxidatus TaxID=48021 RepID=A0ACB8T6Z7_9AGAM|nr:hypothetical protein BV25DRAFT_1883167 [Artomyces pyxidatus]
MQVPSRSGADQRVAEAVRVAPYLTHVIRHHGQLTLIPPDNAGRVRKPKREKRPRPERSPRPNDEPQFNTGVIRSPRRGGQPASPAGRSRAQERRRDESDGGVSIPDYPPPSFDEAVSAAAASPALLTPSATPLTAPQPPPPPAPPSHPSPYSQSRTISPERDPVTIPPIPPSRSGRTVTAPHVEPPSPSSSLRYSTQAEYNDSDSDEGSLEIVSKGEATSSASQWEQDRLKGLSLRERLAREHEREHEREQERQTVVKKKASTATMLTMRPSPSQLTLVPPRQHELERSQDDFDPSSPSLESQDGGLHDVSRNASPSPQPTPKKRLHIFSSLNKSKDRHPTSLPSSPTFGSSQLSLPLHFLRPASPKHAPPKNGTSSRSEGLIARRLFGHKGKEKSVDSSEKAAEPLEAWELLDESPSEDESPVSPETPMAASTSQHFPTTTRPSESAPHLHAPGSSSQPHSSRQKRHSMLDRPVPPPPQSFLFRAEQRAPPPPPSASSSPVTPSSRHHNQQVSFADLSPSPTLTNASSSSPASPGELRASPSMVWAPGPRFPPPQSPILSTVVSPSHVSVQSGITYLDYAPTTPSSGAPTQVAVIAPNAVVRHSPQQQVAPITEPSMSHRADVHENIHSVLRGDLVPGTLLLSSPPPASPGSPTRTEFVAVNARSNQHVQLPALTSPTLMTAERRGVPHPFSPPTPSPLANQSFEEEVTPPGTNVTIGVYDEPPASRVVSGVESLIDLYNHSPLPTNATVPSSPIRESHSAGYSQTIPDWPATDQRHHYPGRPLPRPPGTASPNAVRPVSVDLFMAGLHAFDIGLEGKQRIDLPVRPGASSSSLPGSPQAYTHSSPPPVQVTYVNTPSSPPIDDARNPPPHTPSPFSLSQIPSRSLSPDPAALLPPPSPASMYEQEGPNTSPPEEPRYSEYTDLDVLISRIDEGNHTGDNYEVPPSPLPTAPEHIHIHAHAPDALAEPPARVGHHGPRPRSSRPPARTPGWPDRGCPPESDEGRAGEA